MCRRSREKILNEELAHSIDFAEETNVIEDRYDPYKERLTLLRLDALERGKPLTVKELLTEAAAARAQNYCPTLIYVQQLLGLALNRLTDEGTSGS